MDDVLAAVDLGSNSFRVQVARVVGDLVYPLDSLKETVRLAAGLTEDKYLDAASQKRALECLMRFGERLRGLPAEAVRAVGTNSLRVAKNAAEFLLEAERALGFPIEIVAGREEARLIYLGVANSLPAGTQTRLVVDIGGGSTEIIIGCGTEPIKLESLYMGCVSYTRRFFPDGKFTAQNLRQAELAAQIELQTIAKEFSSASWEQAIGSSGTASAIADVLEANGYAESGITGEGLLKLRAALVKAGDINRLSLPGLSADRAPVLPGGFAIMKAVFSELGVRHMITSSGAMRQGILYDMLGRAHQHDIRDVTVRQFMQRYHVDGAQAGRVKALSLRLLSQFDQGFRSERAAMARLTGWAADLHEIGISVAYSGYHKHSSYIIKNADMPGFSKMEQGRLALLTLAHRGSLLKIRDVIVRESDWAIVIALRLATLFQRSRSDIALPEIRSVLDGERHCLDIDREWLALNPQTEHALREEVREWKKLKFELKITALCDPESSPELVA
ncbi:MAG: exopolyphosphatase [Burkholderiales bacterium]|nr:exopolyphosphatase [Burkholderiales bacterium]